MGEWIYSDKLNEGRWNIYNKEKLVDKEYQALVSQWETKLSRLFEVKEQIFDIRVWISVLLTTDIFDYLVSAYLIYFSSWGSEYSIFEYEYFVCISKTIFNIYF